jgi:hypothetical protein
MSAVWIDAHRELVGWIAFVFVLLVILPGHVWWYKHKDRSLLTSWLIAIPVYVFALGSGFVLLRYWRPLTDALNVAEPTKQIAWYVALGVCIVVANVIWIIFLRFLKRPPTSRA